MRTHVDTLSAQQWAYLEQKFNHALDLQPLQRSEFVRALCSEEPWLCNELASLLDSDQRAERSAFMNDPVAHVGRFYP